MDFAVFRDRENAQRNKENSVNVPKDHQPAKRRSVLGVLNSNNQPFGKQQQQQQPPSKSKVD